MAVLSRLKINNNSQNSKTIQYKNKPKHCGDLLTISQMQMQSSFAELLPADQLQIRIKSNDWNKRRQIYEQILYLLKEQEDNNNDNSDNNNSSDFIDEHSKNKKTLKTFNICGKEYTVKKLIPYFEDIVDEEHHGVLLPALSCVEVMTDRGMCSGREFVKLIDQGFDKFPLKINKGKQIMQKFADIIEKIQLQPQFLLKKISNSAHEKCMIFALQVISMLGMVQLYTKVKQISQKHAKSSVREVASEICKELEQLKGEQQHQETKEEQKKGKLSSNYQNEIQNIQTQNFGKSGKPFQRSKTPTKSSTQQNMNFTRNQLQILEKVPQYEQLESKNQQKFSQNLSQLLQKHFKMLHQGKQVPQLPMNQLSNLSYIIRIMIESNNAITSTNGLKLLHLLSSENSQLLPRSFPLLFIFQKFRLHATHSINQLLYELCDSLLLTNALSTSRNVDLVQAVSQGAANKKGNVRFGCFMVFLRTISILYNKWEIFQDTQTYVPEEILNKINEGDCQKIKQKLYKLLVKCFQNFSSKMSDDKKNEEKLQDIKIAMSLAYGSGVSTAQSAVSSLQNLKNKTFKKNLSQVAPKIQTNVKSSKPLLTQQACQKPRPSTTRSQNQAGYKVINPEQKSSKILQLCQNATPAALSSIKKLILESLLQFQECIEQQRFQLFYYSEVIQNFMALYEPEDKTCDLVSEYIIQLLMRISKMKHNHKIDANSKLLKEGLANMMRICLCNLVIGDDRLVEVFDNFIANSRPNIFVEALVFLDQSKKIHKVKKKNKKIFLEWLHQNIPADCLSDRLFQIIEKTQKNQPLGKNQNNKNEFQDNLNLKQDRQTFGRNKFQQKHILVPKKTQKQKTIKMQKKITFSEQTDKKSNFQNEKKVSNKISQKVKGSDIQKIQKDEKSHIYRQYQEEIKTLQKQRQVRKQKQLQAKQKIVNSSLQRQNLKKQQQQQSDIRLALNPSGTSGSSNILDHSYISQIEYKQDQSIAASSYGYSTDRQLQNQMQIGKTGEKGRKDHEFKYEENNERYQQYYKEYKKQKMKEHDDDMPKFGTVQRSQISNPNFYELSQSKSEVQPHYMKQKDLQNVSEGQPEISDMSVNLEEYKQYVKKIRQDFLPEEYLKQQQIEQSKKQDKSNINNKLSITQKQNQKQKHQIQNIENSKSLPKEQVANNKKKDIIETKVTSKQQCQSQESQQKKQQEESQFEYKIINTKKLNFMLQNAANPYSHLRNEVILPFRKHNQQEYFLQQLSLYLTSIASIKQPQPFNSLLLCVILLFSQIQSNRNLIGPLQQLYEHLASLVSTNQFLKIIISLFHSVIEETNPNLRTFLITILTKSVVRLMPFCEDPVQLLRDFSQFYNVGENVYFEMYQQQYRQICSAIESDALYEVVEKALVQEGENLTVIVESWFETKIKNRIKECIKQIIQQNQQQGIQDEHRFISQQY